MERDVQLIFERLRQGTVPERGLHHFAVGIEKAREELRRQLDRTASGDGAFKFLRGGYGCGKTFTARLAINDAQERNFATSFVVVSDNDLHFHKFDELHRKIMTDLATAYCERAALSDILDRWIGRVEDALVDIGVDEDHPDFDERVLQKLDENLHAATAGKVPQDMVRVLQAIFRLKQEGNLSDAGGLLSWLAGSRSVAQSVKKHAGIKGDIGSNEALDYLHGVLEIIKAAGYAGLLVVIDEAETILRLRRDSRGKSLNGIRQILDASDRFRGLFWIFTGTPEFFDTTRGVKGLQPLYDRVRFEKSGEFVSFKQPQLELRPFNETRLKQVARHLLELFPATQPERLRTKSTDRFIEALVSKVTEGFGGDVGVVPRQFLRKFVMILDLADEHEDYDPIKAENLVLQSDELSEEERRLVHHEAPYESEPEDQEAYEVVNF